MAVNSIGKTNNKFIGLSTDDKPLDVNPGAKFFEFDTRYMMITPDGINWVPFEYLARDSSIVTTIDLEQAAGNYDLFDVLAQDCFIDFIVLIVPCDLTDELVLESISIQSTDTIPVVFVSAEDGALANLSDGKSLIYRGPGVVAKNKIIQLTIAGGATAEECICTVYVSYRPTATGGYLAIPE